MRNLFRAVFEAYSAFTTEEFDGDFVEKAPAWLMTSALAADEALERNALAAEIMVALTERSGGCWNNPELYPPLFDLLRSGTDDPVRLRSICGLAAQLRLTPVTRDTFAHRFFRCGGMGAAVYELDGNEVRTVPGAVLAGDETLPVIYAPLPGLFDDIVNDGFRYHGSPLPLGRSEIVGRIESAVGLLVDYDEGLQADFLRSVGTIAITGDWRPGDRISYSNGSRFPGGIFCSVCTDSPVVLGESFIHEFYHQRLWLWWLIEPPADLPDRNLTMISPVSGLVRAVPVMMQALVIYLSLTDYYRWAAGRFPEESEWAVRRRDTLETGAEALATALREVLSGRPESLRFVTTALACKPAP